VGESGKYGRRRIDLTGHLGGGSEDLTDRHVVSRGDQSLSKAAREEPFRPGSHTNTVHPGVVGDGEDVDVHDLSSALGHFSHACKPVVQRDAIIPRAHGQQIQQ